MVSRGDHSTAGRALTAILFALIAVEIYGFFTAEPWHQTIWYPEGLERLRYFTTVFLGIATPVAILAPWALTPLAAIVIAGCTIHAVGWAATIAPALLVASSWRSEERRVGKECRSR